MEECDLLKERLQAITVKHHIQEVIRQRKLELDQMKLKLQHLKEKALRERWLLQDSANHTQQQSLLSDQQQTCTLQLSIRRMETEVELLERQESVISDNESLILNRLKAVEKSPEDIIKEAQYGFFFEPLQVNMSIPKAPELCSPSASEHSEPSVPNRVLVAMELKQTRNMLTGKSTLLSTAATSTPEELKHHTGLKIFENDGDCVYVSHKNQGCSSELSASEVELLLRGATMNCAAKHQASKQNHSRGDVAGSHNHGRHYGNHVFRNNAEGKTLSCKEKWQRKQHAEHHYGHSLGNHKQLGHHHGNHKYSHNSFCQIRNSHSVLEDWHVNYQFNDLTMSSGRINESRYSEYLSPRSCDQNKATFGQPQSCYVSTSYVPDSILSTDQEELHCYNPPSCQSNNQTKNRLKQRVALYGGSTCEVERPCTILNNLDDTEPVTAIFMGFQTAKHCSEQMEDFDGSLKAELVIIEDKEDHCPGRCKIDVKNYNQVTTESLTSGKEGLLNDVGDRWRERQGQSRIRKSKEKQKACCVVC